MRQANETSINARNEAKTVLHWYDFICPFCYIAQHRNSILTSRGLDVVELPFQPHPDIPPGGVAAGPRKGPMYERLEWEAREAGLPLRWPPRLPNTRMALAAAEWTRRHQPRAFPQLHQALFNAHFALNENLEDAAVIDRHAQRAGVDLTALHAALADGSAVTAVKEAETLGRQYGVEGTPAWLLSRALIPGLLAAAEFEHLAMEARGQELRKTRPPSL